MWRLVPEPRYCQRLGYRCMDTHTQKGDIDSGEAVDCLPSNSVAAQIAALEAKQLRPLRELALGMPGALQRLAELNRQIESLR